MGFACAAANLHTALQLLLNDSDAAPRQVTVLVEDAAAVDTAALFPVMLQARLKLRKHDAAQLFNTTAVPACSASASVRCGTAGYAAAGCATR